MLWSAKAAVRPLSGRRKGNTLYIGVRMRVMTKCSICIGRRFKNDFADGVAGSGICATSCCTIGELQSSLPSIEQIERELSGIEEDEGADE